MEILKADKLLGIKDVIRTEDARVNYLRGLIRIAESDNSKSAGEEGFIYKIAERLGSSYSEMWQAETGTGDNELPTIHFATQQEKILFLMQALYMCWLDNDYSDAERAEIIKIGDELGVEASEVAEIESWIRQGIKWMEAGAELLKLE